MLGQALGKITVNGGTTENILPSAALSTRQNCFYFVECPDKKHSAKTLCREKFCRADFAEALHSAKSLPSAKGSLPSVKTLGKAAASSSDHSRASGDM